MDKKLKGGWSFQIFEKVLGAFGVVDKEYFTKVIKESELIEDDKNGLFLSPYGWNTDEDLKFSNETSGYKYEDIFSYVHSRGSYNLDHFEEIGESVLFKKMNTQLLDNKSKEKEKIAASSLYQERSKEFSPIVEKLKENSNFVFDFLESASVPRVVKPSSDFFTSKKTII